jgi:predicted  nucleic acid-binding Zn-ribbon protein
MRPRGMRDVTTNQDSPLNQKGSLGTARVRGLRDAMATQKVSARATPATHAQQLSEIAWLEREMERLQREANTFEANLQRIHNRLSEVAERRELLLGMVRESLGAVAQEVEDVTAKGSRITEPAKSFDIVALEY